MKKNAKLHNSFKAAYAGLKETLIFEKSFRFMVITALIVMVAMIYFPTTRIEKMILLILIFTVLTLELINSTIERIMDLINPDHDERVRIIKDLMAAIVLLVSLGALAIGLIIFWPYLYL